MRCVKLEAWNKKSAIGISFLSIAIQFLLFTVAERQCYPNYVLHICDSRDTAVPKLRLSFRWGSLFISSICWELRPSPVLTCRRLLPHPLTKVLHLFQVCRMWNCYCSLLQYIQFNWYIWDIFMYKMITTVRTHINANITGRFIRFEFCCILLAYKIFIQGTWEKTLFWRPRLEWKDIIKRGLQEIGWEGVDWVYVAQDGVQQ